MTKNIHLQFICQLYPKIAQHIIKYLFKPGNNDKHDSGTDQFRVTYEI